MPPSEIFAWLLKKVNYINENREVVKKLHLFNTTEEKFGKKYYRIYLEVETTLKPGVLPLGVDESWSEEDRRQFQRYHEPKSDEYVSFYSNYYSNDAVKVNYEWIIELLRATRKGGTYEVLIDNFERDLE